MKVLCTGSVDVFAPVERVFRTIVDIDKWPAWFSGIVSAQQPDGRPVGPEEELYLCLHVGRRRWHESFEVSRYVTNAFFSVEGAYSSARRFDFRLEQRSGTTRVGAAIGYPVFGGWPAVAIDAALRRPRVARAVSDTLLNLKHRIEDASDAVETGSDGFALPNASVVPLPARIRAASGEPLPVA
jgi:uncharacterized membrane protein